MNIGREEEKNRRSTRECRPSEYSTVDIDVRAGDAADGSTIGAHSPANRALCCRGEHRLMGEHLCLIGNAVAE